MRSYQEIIEWLALNVEPQDMWETIHDGATPPLIVFAAFVADVDEEEVIKDLTEYVSTEGIA